MTDKQNPKDDDDDFDFSDPVLSNDFNFDLTEEDIRAANNLRENVIKKQNTINDREAENVSVPSDEYDFDLDDKDDFDFGSPTPKPIWIRKIECTNLNIIEQEMVRVILAFRDVTNRTVTLSNAIIKKKFVDADFENKADFISDIISDELCESKKLTKHGKIYFLAQFERYVIESAVQFLEVEFNKEMDKARNEVTQEARQELAEMFEERRKAILSKK
ncbi:hypothetical protein [Pseudomonas psychrophila]|uniref:hypothetical protein n=1 Tax=Pseudomonas psychrophila TaxID=122355 RepID=UPI000356EBF0|nr:hypothetical protein [Pseudomonas psychrophila]EPJ92142.1 hypothetical protein CF149_19296 [Pseudomonas psychrophila]